MTVLRNALVGAVVLVASQSPSLAGEGGGSAYLQGTFNDFAAGVFGPPGFYLRNDLPGGIAQIVRRDDRQARIGEDILALLHI